MDVVSAFLGRKYPFLPELLLPLIGLWGDDLPALDVAISTLLCGDDLRVAYGIRLLRLDVG